MAAATNPLAWRDGALALGGAAAAGLAIGLPLGLLPGLRTAALLPAIFFGVALLMLPALYVALTTTDAAPSLEGLVATAAAALRDAGAVLLGVAPALLFLGATEDGLRSPVGALVAVALAGLLCLDALRRRLMSPAAARKAQVAFFAWSAVAAGIGARLVVGLLEA